VKWPTATLGEIAASVDYGLTASATQLPEGPKFLRITDIQNDQVDWDSVPFCQATNDEEAANNLAPGDIVFARTGATTGKSFFLRSCPKRAVFASYLIRVRPSDRVDANYLSKFFQSENYWAQIRKSARGATQPGVNSTVLKQLSVPIPPLVEQRRIAAILDQADELRRNRRAALERLGTLNASVFVTMFGDLASNTFKWPQAILSKVVRPDTIVTYGIVQAGEEFEGGVPYIRTGDIVDGEIKTNQLRRTDPAIAARFSRSRVETGEIVMSIRATVGTTAFVPLEIDGANLTQGTARISPGKQTDRHYLLAYLRSAGAQNWLQRQVKGATFREITLSRLREMPILVPPLERQRTFATHIAEIDKIKAHHRTHLAKLDELFASLQQRAFRGEL
jgi:type I restriction enzyme S subunit